MRYLIGPEFIWLLLYSGATLVAKINQSPTRPLDRFIDTCWFWIPMLTLLCFALWWVPSVEKNWLLLRVWIACIIGGHYVMEKIMNAYSEQGPGSGMGYLAGMIFVFVWLVVGTVVVKIKF